MEKEITVIYDADCRFCRATLGWLKKKLQVNEQAFQNAALFTCGLTQEECSKEVFVLADDHVFSGAAAVAYLLHQRGNTISALIIRRSGPFGRFGYRWIASHRNSAIVRLATKMLE